MSSPLSIWHPFTNAAMDAPPLHVVRAEREDAGLGRSEAMIVGRWVKLGRVGALCLAVAWLTSGCQIPQQVVNQPLQNDATGQPIYKPGYALLPMLKEWGMLGACKHDQSVADSDVTVEYLVDKVWIVGSPRC